MASEKDTPVARRGGGRAAREGAADRTASDVALRPRAFALLRELEANNERDWYAAHKAEFRAELLDPFEALLGAITARLARTALPLQGSRKTMYRMHRDVRFSANKLPYKLHVSGLLTPDGTKRETGGIVYLHCDAKGGFVAAGFYLPETAWLEPVRRRMIEAPRAWTKVLRALARAGLELDREHALRSMPRGFSHANDHEHAESVRLKSLIVSRRLAPKAWKDGTVVDATVAMAKEARALIEFAREAG